MTVSKKMEDVVVPNHPRAHTTCRAKRVRLLLGREEENMLRSNEVQLLQNKNKNNMNNNGRFSLSKLPQAQHHAALSSHPMCSSKPQNPEMRTLSISPFRRGAN